MFGILRDENGNPLIVQRYIIEMFLGPAYDPNKSVEEQPQFLEHIVYFAKLILNGTVLLAGPYAAFDGAYVVLSEKVVKTYDAAVAIMDGDPWSKNRVSVAVVRTWDSNPLFLSGIAKPDALKPEEIDALRAQALGAG